MIIQKMLYLCKKKDAMNVLMKEELLELYQKGKSKKYREIERNRELLVGFIRAVNTMIAVSNVSELGGFSHLHYEQLKYEWSGYSSVRLSNRFVHRLIFTETESGIEVELIHIDDTHYGNKK